MTTSGTYGWSPDNGDLIVEAFERCKIDPATLVSRHFKAGITAMNFLFADWANVGVFLFAVDEQTQLLTEDDYDYTAADGTLAILGGSFIRRSSTDTPVEIISREDYAAIPNKTQSGLPTMVWLNRATGLYYLFHAPENSTDVLHYWRLRRLQDAGTGVQTPDAPFRFFEALAAGLAAKLAEKFAPAELEDRLVGKAAAALKRALDGDRERGDASFDLGMI